MALVAPVAALLLVANSSAGVATPVVGFASIAAMMALFGLLTGPMDVGLFTIRQRRTDPAWMGRAFAISMAVNYMGLPIGAALAGALADASLDLTILSAVIATALGALFAAVLVPKGDPGEERGTSVARTAPPKLDPSEPV